MALLKTLLYLIPLFLILANKVHSQDTFFIFQRFSPNPKNLTYEGDARVQPGNKTLSLAGIDCYGKLKPMSVGRVTYFKPVQLWERSTARQAGFESRITFFIKPSNRGAAEGIAFFIAPFGASISDGSADGHLGIYDGPNNTSLFAVEFDTNYNLWDPTYPHIGINIESRTSSNVTWFDAGNGQEVTTTISYDPETRIIKVDALSYADTESPTVTQTASLRYVFDLKTVLPEYVQVGITSATGRYDSIGLPEISEWYFYSTLLDDVNDGIVNEDDARIRQYVSG